MKTLLYELIRKVHFIRAQIVYYILANRDENVKNLLKEQIAMKYIKKKYVNKYYRNKKINDNLKGEVPKVVWIYWKQGKDRIPSIVDLCIESVKKTFEKENWTVNFIDYEFVKNNLEMDSYIFEKYEHKQIKDSHFSDLVRLNILNRFGGCWIDATVLMSAHKVPNYISKAPFFVYQNYLKNDSYINISNWLISSCKHNPILEDVYNILLEYWKKEKCMIQYYGFHIIFKLVSEQYPSIWENVYIMDNIAPHILQSVGLKKIKKNILNEIIENSDFHKLTWRIPNDIEENSVFKNIIDRRIEI